jgi:phosphoglycolate phosphatase-like HAD superfamily hydrolase
VATGHYPSEELATHGPDLLFDSFAEVDRALSALPADS